MQETNTTHNIKEEKERFFEESSRLFKEYIDDRILLMRFKLSQKISKFGSSLISGLLIGVFAFMFTLFVSITLAYFIGQWLDNIALGFAIVSGIFLISLLLIIFVFKKTLRNKLIDMLINLSFERKDDDETEEEAVANAN